MPVDEGTRGTQPALKPKPKPHPALQEHFNFHGSVQEFNARVERIHREHEASVGYKPSGGLVYDVAKSQIKDEQIPVLFRVPKTKRAAKAASFAIPRTGEDISRGQRVETTSSGLTTEEHELFYGRPPVEVEAERYGQMTGEEQRKFVASLRSEPKAKRLQLLAKAHANSMGVAPEDPLGLMQKVVSTAALGAFQAYGALTVGPAMLAIEEGKAVKKSVEQKSPKPFAQAQKNIGEAIITGFYEDGKAIVTRDWDYIMENPGFIALDLLGVGKLAAAPIKAGGGTRTVRVGDLETQTFRSENAAAALIGDARTRMQQRAANKRHDTEQVLTESALGYTAKKNFGFERKVGRALERQRQLEIALRDEVRRDLERATGWSTRAAGVKKAVGMKAHRGLTRGENMALFVESLDVPGSWSDRAAALRAAHQKWLDEGVGDPAAHQQKLRDITLAERAMRKPSKRFESALTLTRQAVDEMEEIKVRELGLDASTASGRVAKAGEVVRTGEKLEDWETPIRQREDSFYVPTTPPRQTRPLAKSPFRPKRFGAFGASLPDLKQLVPELSHQFTGRAMQAGDYRIDTTRLVGDAVGRTVRASSILSQHAKLLGAATDRKVNEFQRPIRTKEGVPTELRDILNRTDEGELIADEVGALSKADAEAMLKELFPGQRGRNGWTLDKDIEGVKWVDERLIDPSAWTQPMPTAFVKSLDVVNAPFRFVTLYLRPAYLLNLLGATGTALIYQGPFAPPNIARAIFADKVYGTKVANSLKDLVGGGRATSYVAGRPVTEATHRVAQFWNAITDERLRMSTAFYYGRKAGIKTKEQWEELLDGAKRGDKDAFNKLDLIVDRTKKGMVQFDNLTWFEQNVLRHAIFIYPWQRGAAVWSVRTLMERPITSAALAQFGREQVEEIEDVFTQRIPEWFKNTGYIPFGFDGNGDPKVVNPSALNTFSTLNSLMHARIEQLLGPAGELAVRTATEKDEFGNEYPSTSRPGRWRDAAVDVLGALPQVTAFQRANKKADTPLPPVDPSDRRSLIGRLDAALKQTVLSPGWLDGYGQLLTGAAGTERSVNRLALTARWYKEATFEERSKFQKELINRALAIQGDLMGRPVNMNVRRVVNLQFDRDKAVNVWQREKGRDATPMEETLLDIQFLKEKGLVTDEDVADLTKKAKRLASADEHTDFRSDTFEQFADPDGVLRAWDESVRRVNALATPAIVNERIQRLAENGVNDGAGKTALKREQLVEYGRVADKYAREVKRRMEEIEQLRKTDPDQVAAADAALVAWKSEQDKPVRIAGRTLPSPARMEWAKEYDFDKRVDAVAELASRQWKDLTRFERDLLGKKSTPDVVKGWQKLEELKAEFIAGQPRGERSIPRDFENQAARYINRTADGFYKDWLYAQEPLAIRLQTMRPIIASPNAAEWRKLFLEVKPAIQALKNGAPSAHLRDSWKDYVNSSSFPTFSAGFRAELDRYGIDPAEDLF